MKRAKNEKCNRLYPVLTKFLGSSEGAIIIGVLGRMFILDRDRVRGLLVKNSLVPKRTGRNP